MFTRRITQLAHTLTCLVTHTRTHTRTRHTVGRVSLVHCCVHCCVLIMEVLGQCCIRLLLPAEHFTAVPRVYSMCGPGA